RAQAGHYQEEQPLSLTPQDGAGGSHVFLPTGPGTASLPSLSAGRTPAQYETGPGPCSSAWACELALRPAVRAGWAPPGFSPSAVKQRMGGRWAEERAGANEATRTPQILSAKARDSVVPRGRRGGLLSVKRTQNVVISIWLEAR